MHDIDAILGKMREAIPAGPVRIKEAVEGGGRWWAVTAPTRPTR